LASVYDGKTEKKFDNFEKITHYIMYIGEFMEEKAVKNGQRLTCGGAVGLANSLFGGGGGMIAVPLLQKTGLEEKRAHATAILLILPISLLSFILYVWRGLYDPAVLIPTALGVTAGGFFGAQLLGKMPVKTVNLVFAALQAAAGLFLLL
jgi:uncharacterized membrane protein YfcA